MGTRNLTIVKLGGKVKVAQYGQWDGYPTGVGAEIAKFLQSKAFKLADFKKRVKALVDATDQEIKDTWTACGADPNSDSVTFDIADRHKAKYPQFSRDTGAGILALIAKGKVDKIDNQIDFLKDSLFCEWAYMVNLDTGTVSVYKGFQVTSKKDANGRTVYGKCKVIKRYKIEHFTTAAMKILEDSLNDE